MYTYAVQRCQNEKKTLLFVLMESKGEEDIWRSCLQFSLSTRKKRRTKASAFISLSILYSISRFFKALEKRYCTPSATQQDGQSKLVHEIQEVVKETLQL